MFFLSDRVVRGDTTKNFDDPKWEPLLELAPDHVEDFMWMFEVELESGLRLHADKHIETREYIHLDSEGRAFAYLPPRRFREGEPSSYREVDPERALREALRHGG